MRSKITAVLFMLITLACEGFALEPAEVGVIANKNCRESLDIARFYCGARNIPTANILELSLPWPAADSVSRDEYNSLIAKPVKAFLTSQKQSGSIKCLVTTWGIPIKVGPAKVDPKNGSDINTLKALYDKKSQQLTNVIAQLGGMGLSEAPAPPKDTSLASLYELSGKNLNSAIARITKMPAGKTRTALYLRWLGYCEIITGKNESINAAVRYQNMARPLTQAEQAFQVGVVNGHISLVNTAQSENWSISEKVKKGYYGSLEQAAGLKGVLAALDNDISVLSNKESNAAVDSELSMVLCDDYPLSRFYPNPLKDRLFVGDTQVVMISRLDGPTPNIAKELVTRAINAEKTGVDGRGYFDLRMNYGSQNASWPTIYDRSLTDAASAVETIAGFKTRVESTAALFGAGACPKTALYCGWYSLQKYIPSCKFVPGAVAYHIASFEAVHLREKNSEWCSSMLSDGVTATIGAVAEPYLHAFPLPAAFFTELLGDNCLVEAYYKTLPFNSWQIILIGDPLYKFKVRQEKS